MKRKRLVLLVAIFAASSSAAARAETSDETLEQLKALTREIQLLRSKVELLEQRVNALEPNARSPFEDLRVPLDPLRFLGGEIIIEVPRTMRGSIGLPFEPPLNHDTGLYVFPGLDAPPLSPADVPR